LTPINLARGKGEGGGSKEPAPKLTRGAIRILFTLLVSVLVACGVIIK